MSQNVPKAGRKEPDLPELKDSQRILSISLKKSWARTPSYWVEVYGKFLPPATLVHVKKISRYYVYRQWSFIKGNGFGSGKRELVDGYILDPNLITNVNVLAGITSDYLEKLLIDKRYEIDNIEFPPVVDTEPTEPGVVEVLSRLSKISEKMLQLQNVENSLNDQVEIDNAVKKVYGKKKEDFWDTVRQRERKAKW